MGRPREEQGDVIKEEQRERLDDSDQAEARKHLVTIEPVVGEKMKDIARE